MDSLNSILSAISTVVWGPFILIPLLLGTGLWLTIRLGGLQFRALGRATRHVFAADSDDESTEGCLLYTSPSPRDVEESRMPSSA